MKAIADIESYPDWISEYKEVEVLEALDDGYPKKARMLMDAGIFKDTLIMNYQWPADRQSLSWTLESSSLLKSLVELYDAGTAWAVLYLDQPTGKGKELVRFLHWATHEGQAHVRDLRFAPLPPELVARIEQKLRGVPGGS